MHAFTFTDINNRHFGWDDYFHALALLLLFGFIITLDVNQSREDKFRSHSATVEDYIVFARLQYVYTIFMFGSIYAVKASFLALYFQIFRISRRFRIAWSFATTFIVAAFLATVLSYLWTCGGPGDVFDPITVLNVVGDLILLVLPCAMLKSMLMRTSQKLGLALVFSLVLLVVTFTIVRTYFAMQTGSDGSCLSWDLTPKVGSYLRSFQKLLSQSPRSTTSGSSDSDFPGTKGIV
ncbi:hypothetical protein EJ04DRAFT_527150 [Polyplosphaeria fusca]|uniref:Rhodopsin domain-containing protein n=1 Tax=Polyplosphaeria fusca TaxID=682080 RepID=A0A9P4UVP8_9PLEO|nr:hypothetical protein EJ04DRAFT_527150 [Polyplosphaeria fusca]